VPVNCPLPYRYDDENCEGCRYLSDNRCWYTFPSRSINEILTPHERIDMLERRVAKLEKALFRTVPEPQLIEQPPAPKRQKPTFKGVEV